MKCIYCTTPLMEGRKLRIRPVSLIIDEVEYSHKNYGVKSFFFVDSIFNYPEEYALSLCNEILSRKLHINWTCIINPSFVSSELAEIMKKAGCHEISLGFESGSEKILKTMKKGFSTEEVKKASELFKKYNIKQRGFLLFGSPGETKKNRRRKYCLRRKTQYRHDEAYPCNSPLSWHKTCRYCYKRRYDKRGG